MIKRITFVSILMLSSQLFADENKTVSSETNSSILNEELQKAIELEKKYAKEQKFYTAESYDFKAVEVNKKSLEGIQAIEMDDPYLDSDAILGMSEEENLSW